MRFLLLLVLWQEVLRATGHAVFVRPVVHLRRHLEIAVRERRRRRRRPLERGGLPRVRSHWLALEDAPEEIEDERNLEQHQPPGRVRHELVPVQHGLRVRVLHAAVIEPAVHAMQPLDEHREENAVDEDERAEEMNLAQQLAHLTSRGFREPVVDAGQQREDRPRRHDVVEVPDDVIRVMQVDVARCEAERQTGQSADAEHRQERQGEQHWRVVSNRPAVERQEQARSG